MSRPEQTVFVVDDDVSFLKSVTRLLRASGLAVQPFSSAAGFLSHRAAEVAGCVVADLSMPGMNGAELQEALAKSDNPLPIVFLTGQGDIPASVEAMRQGAEDFLTKHASKDTLLAAVKRALERDTRERAARHRRRELGSRFASLTPREREVLAQVLRGRMNKEIAADLGIDERSVKRHRTSLMGRLQMHSLAELVHLAHEAQWSAGTAD